MAKVLVFLADGFEEVEALSPVDLLRRASVDVEVVSISDELCVTGARKIKVLADRKLSDADFENAKMLVLPGGMPGTINLEKCDPLMKKVDQFVNEGKYVAAICAAPTILGHRGLLRDKNACCYPGMQDQLEGANVSYEEVTVDNNIITSRGMGTAANFALKLVELMVDKATAENLAKAVVYQQ